ncbi:MAG: hypothetical protein GKR94_25145 [Gammaproteobacteria bacterium]|nr:hypothetical protein [Gammaproteobacteria bacterium]
MPGIRYAITAVLAILLLIGAIGANAAKIKCWRNNEGIRECGNTVPPEFAQQGHEERSTTGVTVRRQGKARDKAEVEAERRAKIEVQKAAMEENKRRQAQAVKDRVLLDTFVNERDMTLAHQQNKEAIAQRTRHSANHIWAPLKIVIFL